MIRRMSLALVAVVILATAAFSATSANAATDVDPEIAHALELVPGGVAIDAQTAVWPALSMTMTVPQLRARDAVGTCPNGSICAFSGANLTGSRLSWTLCGTYSTAVIGAVRSIADAKSTGTLQARYGSTVLATSVAQSWASVTGTVDNVYCA